MSSSILPNSTISHPYHQLIELISPWVHSLGYRIIHLEVQAHRQKTLRIFIDHLDPSTPAAIGIEDCVKVARALDEPLDQLPEIEAAFQGAYELEISSPGVDRPLRTATDFEQFKGQEIRVHVYRPLTSEELGDASYQEKNPKQKNFLGALLGLQEDKVILLIDNGSHKVQKEKKKSELKKKETELTSNSAEGVKVTIPLPLISKANLEPKFSFEKIDERE